MAVEDDLERMRDLARHGWYPWGWLARLLTADLERAHLRLQLRMFGGEARWWWTRARMRAEVARLTVEGP